MYNSRFSSVKVYRRYGFGAIFSGLCSLGILAMFAILAFFPLFFFKTESNPEGSLISGLDFVFYGIRKFYAALDTHKLDAFAESLSTYGDNNQFLKYVVQFREYIEIGLVGILAIAVIMAAIVGKTLRLVSVLFWNRSNLSFFHSPRHLYRNSPKLVLKRCLVRGNSFVRPSLR